MIDPSNELDDLLHRGYRYALSLAHDNELAQDLVQDACVRISRRGGPWNVRYMITTIRNGYIDHYRRAAKFDFTSLEESHLIDNIDMSMTIFDPQLESALSKLRDDERELLYLSIVEGYSAREIGELTKRPRGTILSILHRAKAKLKVLLTESENEAV